MIGNYHHRLVIQPDNGTLALSGCITDQQWYAHTQNIFSTLLTPTNIRKPHSTVPTTSFCFPSLHPPISLPTSPPPLRSLLFLEDGQPWWPSPPIPMLSFSSQVAASAWGHGRDGNLPSGLILFMGRWPRHGQMGCQCDCSGILTSCLLLPLGTSSTRTGGPGAGPWAQWPSPLLSLSLLWCVSSRCKATIEEADQAWARRPSANMLIGL